MLENSNVLKGVQLISSETLLVISLATMKHVDTTAEIAKMKNVLMGA